MKTTHSKILTLLATLTLPAFAQDQRPDTHKHQPEETRPEKPAPDGDRAWLRIQRMGQFHQEGVPRDEMPKPPQENSTPWRIGLGVVPVEDELRIHLDIPKDTGVVVKEVMPNGPADKAKIKENDIIIKANGQPIASLEQLRGVVSAAQSRHMSIRLLVIQSGKRGEVTIENEMPKPDLKPNEGMLSPQPPRQLGMMMDPRMMIELRGQISSLTDRIEKQHREIEELKKLVRERNKDEDRKKNSRAQKEEEKDAR